MAGALNAPPSARIDDARFARRMAEQAAILACGIALTLLPSLALKIAGSVLLGVVFARNLEFAHECIHATALRSRRANRTAGTLLCLPMFVCFRQWRREHAQHHADVRREGFRYEYDRLHGARELLVHVFMLRHFVRAARDLRRPHHLVQLLLPLAALALSFPLHAPMLLWWWAIPVALGAVVHTHVELPEHFGTEGASGDAFATSWVIRAGTFATWFVNANNFHAVHHYWPRLPQSALQAAHATLRDRVRYESTYPAFFVAFYRQVLRN